MHDRTLKLRHVALQQQWFLSKFLFEEIGRNLVINKLEIKCHLLSKNTSPVDTGRKLNVHKTFRRRTGRLLNVLCTFNLRSMSTGRPRRPLRGLHGYRFSPDFDTPKPLLFLSLKKMLVVIKKLG